MVSTRVEQRLIYHILLVEDDRLDKELISQYLKEAEFCQYQLDWASSFEEGWKKLHGNPHGYDVVILDYLLGSKTGLDFLKQLQAEEWFNLPVVILTGQGDPQIDFEAMKLGASDYIVKEKMEAGFLDRSIRYVIEQRKNSKLIARQQREIASNLKMAALGEAASTITHEINNPLMVIQGRAAGIMKLISDGSLEKEKVSVYTESILKMVERIMSIKDGIKKSYGNLGFASFEEYSVLKLVRESIELCSEVALKNGVSVTVDTPDDLTMVCRPVEISQVLVNLITNACEAVSSLEEKWVKVNFSKVEENVEISVTDSGKGLKAEDLDRVFSKFYTTKSRGFGIGLNLSRKIVASHGGKLEINRKVKNTQFIITLPVEPRPNDKTYSILIVEDETDISSVIQEEVVSRGHEVVTETDGLKAWNRVQEEKFDALILDIYLPGQTGIELADTVTSTLEKSPKILFITGYANSQIRKTISEKTSVLFEKPLNVKDLVDYTISVIEAEPSRILTI